MCECLPKQYGQTDFDQGSFSTGGVWDSRFVYRIPDKMKSEDAAPTLCGGWSVWNALIGYDLKPADQVGIVGIGGPGHFAIQFANKMGCEVTAFSATESKKADSLALGAHHFVNTNLPVGERLKVARQINKLLVCTNAHILWELFTQGLVGKATIFPLHIPTDMASKLSVPHMPFLMKSINLIYSTNGWHDAYDKLLAFAALHSIKSVSEKFPLTGEGIEDGLNKLEKGTVRYRGVLAAEA
jgi:D-arabinose 1-dehydrogenase-like Zn-dependent alcohol dehydrogenase